MNKNWERQTDPHHLRDAVIAVYDQVAVAGREAGADYWTANHTLIEHEVMPRVVAIWCGLANAHPTDFLWSTDAVAMTWLAWRKKGRIGRQIARDEYGLSPVDEPQHGGQE